MCNLLNFQGKFFRIPDDHTKVEEVLRGSEYELFAYVFDNNSNNNATVTSITVPVMFCTISPSARSQM